MTIKLRWLFIILYFCLTTMSFLHVNKHYSGLGYQEELQIWYLQVLLTFPIGFLIVEVLSYCNSIFSSKLLFTWIYYITFLVCGSMYYYVIAEVIARFIKFMKKNRDK